MPTPVFKGSRSSVDRAGRILSDLKAPQEEWEKAYGTIAEWRAAHVYPMNILHAHLSRTALAVDPAAQTSKRLKRLKSIGTKLLRERYRLSQLQDMVGCRAVVKDTAAVNQIVERLLNSRSKHSIIALDDYVMKPRDTGYRSVHMVYRFRSPSKPEYDGYMCELQVRSLDQHAWACAVEATSLIRNEDLKAGIGNVDWLHFFRLVAQSLARRECCPHVPGAPTTANELFDALSAQAKKIDAINWLGGVRTSVAMYQPDNSECYWFLLHFNSKEQRLRQIEFTLDETEEAFKTLKGAEISIKDKPHEHVVLVSADSLAGVFSAFPSFFGSAEKFSEILSQLLFGYWMDRVPEDDSK